jgi:Tol biopolymer transport system component
MDRNGRNKRDLTQDSSGFAYGFSSSPDGLRISYHENYQVYLANADGSDRMHVQTGHPFVFAPSWSPDGQWLLFVSGEHYNCHPHVVKADGTGLRKLADRNGYRGVTQFLDVPDAEELKFLSPDVLSRSAAGREMRMEFAGQQQPATIS